MPGESAHQVQETYGQYQCGVGDPRTARSARRNNPMTKADPESTTGSLQSALSLLAAALLITLVWCWVLPWLSARPANSQYLQFLDEQGIDPSAMFYTELDAMAPILRRIEER